ncbi:MAG: hypothetical protein ACFE94_05830 [Candidatus Hodarchaeota archaeon]
MPSAEPMTTSKCPSLSMSPIAGEANTTAPVLNFQRTSQSMPSVPNGYGHPLKSIGSTVYPSLIPSVLSPSKHHILPRGRFPITSSTPLTLLSRSAAAGEEGHSKLPPT